MQYLDNMKTENPNIQSGQSIAEVIERLTEFDHKYHDYEFPKITIIIPVYNCSQSIANTLKSVLTQEYPDFEVLIIDAESKDRTLEVVKGYRDSRIHIYSVSDYHPYEMINKGISQAQGLYINILYPGDFYIHHFALKQIICSALDHNLPQLVYCGSLLRDGRTDVKILFREFNLKLLYNGQQPTSLQACWFKSEVFQKIGKINTVYKLRGGFDLLCRFCLEKDFHAVATDRILTDYDLHFVTQRLVMLHFVETFRILTHYFGMWKALRWVLIQKDSLRFIKLWFRSMKVAFLGR